MPSIRLLAPKKEGRKVKINRACLVTLHLLTNKVGQLTSLGLV